MTSRTTGAVNAFLDAEEQLVRAREEIGRSIYERRQALKLSGAQVAAIARVNASELSKLERAILARGVDLARRVDETLTRIEQERAGDAARSA